MKELADDEIPNFYFFLVAICHQTQFLRGRVDGRFYRGWDYLLRKFESNVIYDRRWLNPTQWAQFTEDSLRELFSDEEYGVTLSNMGGRARLIRDLGKLTQRRGWLSINEIYAISAGRIASGSPNLL